MPIYVYRREFRLMLAFVFLFGAVVGAHGQAQASSTAELHGGIPILVDAAEDPAIQAAVADLRRDLRNVLGEDSNVVSATGDLENRPAIVVTCHGAGTGRFRDKALVADEAYSITRSTAGPLRIVLQGSDVRGTIYSIYDFSEHALGVPPLWFWSGWQPRVQSLRRLFPDVFHRVEAPSVRWRGWFPNDTDMLAPWLNASDGHIAIFMETLLRLRYNVLDVDHISNWNNKPNLGLVLARQCKARGIKVTFTHLAPFGFLLGDWDSYWSTVRHMPSPPRLLSNLKAMDEYWTYAIHFVEDEHLDVIQSIEFRVDGDKPFWRSFPDAPKTDEERARVISSMLSHEMQLLRRVSRGPMPLTRTVFYNEVGGFLDAGELAPPTDPKLIWNYANEQRDHYPRPEISAAHSSLQDFGYYFNLQFFTTGSHVAAGEGPWKLEHNLRDVAGEVHPGRLTFVVLNIGNLREFAMEITVASKLLWDSDATADGALKEFIARYFDPAFTDALHGLYRDYYDAYWQQKQSSLKGFPRQYIFHDLRYARAAENLLARIETEHYTAEPLFQDPHMLNIEPSYSGASDETQAILNGTESSGEKFAQVVAAAQAVSAKIAPEDRKYFNENLVSDAMFLLSANRFLHEVADAYVCVGDANAAQQHLTAAAAHLLEMQQALATRKQLSMPDWYDYEKKFDLNGLSRRLEHARVLLAQKVQNRDALQSRSSKNNMRDIGGEIR
jgi:hypothetical protein